MRRCGLLVVFLTLLVPGLSRGAEPRVGFALDGPGLLRFTVTQDGKPVPAAEVKVFDDVGAVFAEGETGANGSSLFPLPRQGGLTLEFKIGKRTSDPVVLLPTGSGVEPENVLLSFGLRPCCRVISRGSVLQAEGVPEPPVMVVPASRVLPYTAIAVCFLGGASLLFLALRPASRRPS